MGLTFDPPSTWPRLETVDVHVAGEPLRVVTKGLPPIPGDTILAKRRYAQEHLDLVRRQLMWEPRGHADMYGAILTDPVTEDGDLGVLFMHNEGFSTMCGHGIIGLVKVVLETGVHRLAERSSALKIDTPAGRVVAEAMWDRSEVCRVSFVNVPSFVSHEGVPVELDGIGRLECDVAFGGAFYAFLGSDGLGVTTTAQDAARLISLGRQVTKKVSSAVQLEHPESEDLAFLYGTIIVGPPGDQGVHSRHVCIFAEGELDRSPTGTGVSARAALLFEKGQLSPREKLRIESIIGTWFEVEILEVRSQGQRNVVIPRVSGAAHFTGTSCFFVDPTDPLSDGFILR